MGLLQVRRKDCANTAKCASQFLVQFCGGLEMKFWSVRIRVEHLCSSLRMQTVSNFGDLEREIHCSERSRIRRSRLAAAQLAPNGYSTSFARLVSSNNNRLIHKISYSLATRLPQHIVTRYPLSVRVHELKVLFG